MNYQPAGSATDQATAEDAEQSIFALLDAARSLQERLESTLEAVGLSGAKYTALAALAAAREPLPLSELAGKLRCVRSNVTQLTDRLEADGLVRRVADPADRRAVRAELTSLGAEKQLAGRKALQDLQSELAARVDPAERALFHRVLAALR